jgi:hypothetical protein
MSAENYDDTLYHRMRSLMDSYDSQKSKGKESFQNTSTKEKQRILKEEQMRKVRNLLNSDVQESIRSLQREFEDMKRDFRKETDDLLNDRYSVPLSKARPQQANSVLPVYDQKRVIDKLEYFNIHTHKVNVKLVLTTIFEARTTSKLIGIETVDWWEYMFIYGFLKKFKISYEHEKHRNAPKLSNNVKYVNKHVLNLKFNPVSEATNVQKIEQIKDNKKILVETGNVYRSVELNVEIPYVAVTKQIEVQRGYLLFEDTIETMEVDHSGLEKNVTDLLTEKNVNSDLKNKILTYLKNGRLSGF